MLHSNHGRMQVWDISHGSIFRSKPEGSHLERSVQSYWVDNCFPELSLAACIQVYRTFGDQVWINLFSSKTRFAKVKKGAFIREETSRTQWFDLHGLHDFDLVIPSICMILARGDYRASASVNIRTETSNELYSTPSSIILWSIRTFLAEVIYK